MHKRLDLNGGTERDLFKTAEGLCALGHEVHLFCSEFGVAAPQGVTAHRIPVIPLGRTLRLWSFALWAPKSVQRTGCNVVVSFGRMLEQDVLRSGGGTHRGFLATLGEQRGALRRLWHSISVYHRSLLALEQRQFDGRRLPRIIAVSDQVKRDILHNYAVPADKISVLYNGVDPNRFHPNQRTQGRDALRGRWGIPLDAPLVLFVGSGFRRKGLDRLISIWNSPRLARVYLLVVGADARLSRYRARSDFVARGRIVFAGRQDAIENFYGAADVVALPALQEAFGNVVLEALASGLPVLVSRNVGAAALLRGRLAGGIVDRPDDPRELSSKLLSLLEMADDPTLRREARQIGEEHSWERYLERLEGLLRQACAAPIRACVS